MVEGIKYAIKVPFEDSFLYVTIGSMYNLKVKTYDTLVEARIEARVIWGPHAQVVEYIEGENE